MLTASKLSTWRIMWYSSLMPFPGNKRRCKQTLAHEDYAQTTESCTVHGVPKCSLFVTKLHVYPASKQHREHAQACIHPTVLFLKHDERFSCNNAAKEYTPPSMSRERRAASKALPHELRLIREIISPVALSKQHNRRIHWI